MDKKDILLLIASIILSIVLGLLLIGLRDSGYKIQKQNWWDWWNTQFDTELGWAPIKSSKGDIVSSNSLGFRSPEPTGKKQILILGDSIAFGFGVKDNETASYYLQELLNEKDIDLDVQNMGVTGYSIDQYYLYLKRMINSTYPEYLVLVLCSKNDLYGMYSNNMYKKSKPLLKVINGGLVNINGNISKYSCMNIFSPHITLNRYQWFRKLVLNICGEKRINESEVNEIMDMIFHKIGVMAQEHNSTILLVLSPDLGDYTNTSKDYNIFNEYFNKSSFNYINYRDIIKEKGIPPVTLYLPDDTTHYSPGGNKILAETIFKELNLT